MRARQFALAAAGFVLGCSSGGGGSTGGAGGQSGGIGGSGSGGTAGLAIGGRGGIGGVTGGSDATGGSSASGGSAGQRAAGGAGGQAGNGAAGRGGNSGGGRAGTSSGGQAGAAAGAGGAAGPPAGWTLIWSDEFNGPDNSAVDAGKWVHDVGGNGWGNQELEYYTDGTQNAVVIGGNLVITATTAGAASHTCSYPSNGACKYTSARLLTKGKFSQKYGRFEARIQIPEGQGIWPAFWMMGANIDTVSWPRCGEIDVMENIGSEPAIDHGSMHMPAAGSTADSELTGMYALPGGAKLGDAFHTYAVEWSASAVKFYVDDNLYETQTPQSATNRTWEFDQPFFILLNVAVGGQWPGAPDSSTSFPQTMRIDYVRVYTASP